MVSVSIEMMFTKLSTVFHQFPNTSKFVTNTPLRVVFQLALTDKTSYRYRAQDTGT